MKHGSLFSGIGGFDLAAEWMGWENVFHCEWNPFCQKILHKNFPNSIQYGDITKTDFTEWKGKIDIVSGGFPCQPYSQAGKRKGTEDDRHLWPEMLRAIREIRPCWIVGENVPGLLNWERGMVLKQIETDLETSGYKVCPSLILPAGGKDAQHRRDRLWIVAHSYGIGLEREIQFNREPKKTNVESSVKSTSYNAIEQLLLHRSDLGLRKNDGVSNWVDRINSLGNSIVPQVVYEIFKAIEECEKNMVK